MGLRGLRLIAVCLATAFCILADRPASIVLVAHAQTDLDEFMGQVLAKRDDNWKKLQQYVLDEREAIDVLGPARTPIWADRREYTWFIRDGFFVRSPVKVGGVVVGEADRRKAEAEYLRHQQEREKRRARRDAANTDAPTGNVDEADKADKADRGDKGDRLDNIAERPALGPEATGDVSGLIRQTREPQFISSAYFLRFKFEQGKYALVGREKLDGRDVLRIEYYPAQLFRGTDRRRSDHPATDEDKALDAEFRRLMNKTSLVTLWVEPSAHQILKYTFDNVAIDFLPAQWLVHVDDLHASMTMGQPFEDVWLPSTLSVQAAVTLAAGRFDFHYGLEYHDYRRADVTTKVTVPKDKDR